MLSSQVFARPERLRRFLRFIVEEAVAGRTVNEYSIAMEVYDRKSSFDPANDSIVRTEVSRLRLKLAEYYRIEGSDRSLVIEIPPRSYIPVFRQKPTTSKESTSTEKVGVDPARPWYARRAVVRFALPGLLTTLSVSAAIWWAPFRLPWNDPVYGIGNRTVSIAVLPFTDVSQAKDQAHLGDGLAEEITEAMSHIPGIQVVSRTSSFAHRGTGTNIRNIGKDLNADTVLEGSVRTQAGALRIVAQLIDVRTGYHVWSASYERSMQDPFAVEQEIALGIATALRRELVRGDARPHYAPKVETYSIYLEGLHYSRLWSADSLGKAIELLERAVAADPNYADAWAALAETRTVLAIHAGFPPETVMPQAKTEALKALELQPDSASAHAALGLVNGLYEWNWEEARKHLKQAHEMAPRDAGVHEAYIMGYLVPVGELDEALRQVNEALSFDPASTRISSVAAMVHNFRNEPDQALALLKKTLELDPQFLSAHLLLGSVYGSKGMYPQAVEEIRLGQPAWESGVGRAALASIYARMGETAKARARLNELLGVANHHYISAIYIAQVYLALGDRETALDWLEKAYAQRSTGLSLLKVSARFNALRSEPRFTALLKKVGLA